MFFQEASSVWSQPTGSLENEQLLKGPVYLEMRFGKFTRCAVSFMYSIQMILYSSCVLYSPALCLTSVSDISLELAIVLCGGVCTFYCFLGGLKAVLWTDVFQQILMFLCIFAIIFAGLHEVGFGEFYTRASAGGRLNFFNFSLDATKRYTTWNVFFRGFNMALGFYGTSQVFVQRFLCLGGCKNAQSTLLWSTVSVSACLFLGSSLGIVLFAVFYLCDPILDTQTDLTKYDQLVPYFIVTRFHSIPGLTGLCIAGIFSGALSTLSSTQNALSMITVVDFIKPLFPAKLSDKTLLLIGKFLAIFYGAIFIGLSLAVSKVDSMLAAGMLSLAVVEGPLVAVFLIGVLTRKGSDKIIVTSLLLGFAITGWIGLNTMFSGYRSSPLPLEVSGCLKLNTSTTMSTSWNSSYSEIECCQLENTGQPYENNIFFLHKIASFWMSSLGTILTICIALFLVLLTGWSNNAIPVDSKCLSPVTRYWFKQNGCLDPIFRKEDDTKTKEKGDRSESVF